ncbi:MAG: hypothetical protein AAB065_00015, partial [Deltaproteobacteria bacterium]
MKALISLSVVFLAAAIVFGFPVKAFSTDTGATKLMVLPLKINAPKEQEYLKGAVMDMLSSRLGGKDGVELLSAGVAANAAIELGEHPGVETLSAVSGKTGADFILYGSISVIGESVSLDVSLFNAKTGKAEGVYSGGKGIGSLTGLTEDVASQAVALMRGTVSTEAPFVYTGKFAKAEEKKEVLSGKEEKAEEEGFIVKKAPSGTRKVSWKVDAGDEFVKAMEIFDADGDGVVEVFVLAEKSVTAYKFGDNGLKKMKTFDTSGENVSMTRFVRNDGKTEFYVSRLGINQAETCKINYVKGELSLGSCEMKHLVRAIEIKGKHVLLGQEFRREWGFRKTVFVLKEEGAGFSRSDVSIRSAPYQEASGRSGDFILPDGVNLYGFELTDLTGDGVEELLLTDDGGYFKIYEKKDDSWAKAWQSTESYGTTLNAIDLEGSADAIGKFVFIKNRFYVLTDGENKTVAIKKLIPGGIFGAKAARANVFDKGSVVGLSWDGAALDEA